MLPVDSTASGSADNAPAAAFVWPRPAGVLDFAAESDEVTIASIHDCCVWAAPSAALDEEEDEDDDTLLVPTNVTAFAANVT